MMRMMIMMIISSCVFVYDCDFVIVLVIVANAAVDATATVYNDENIDDAEDNCDWLCFGFVFICECDCDCCYYCCCL